ncbi:unnamed protein product [Clavelina lepadiformis]|uniref:Uncharacterized protein n=1 Tax=Clavelina lepadiformis TaxID=159417 RepID=A0ABP0H3V8_CLALP
MNKYDRFYDEACSEARDVINGWMNDKLRSELTGNDDDTHDFSNDGRQWHQDSDVFLQKFLSNQNYTTNLTTPEPEMDLYAEDEDATVSQLMHNMHVKLATSSLKDYEAQETKNKPVAAKNPQIAMEVRQQQVKEARQHRIEQINKKKLEQIERKERDALAKKIVQKEIVDRAFQQKIDEQAIQREMTTIRKRMQELRMQHPKSMDVPLTEKHVQSCEQDTPNLQNKASSLTVYSMQEVDLQAFDKKNHNKCKLDRIRRFEKCRKQKILRSSFQHWMKMVLSQRAFMGKAKALADWHNLLKTWSAWRRYCFEQAALRDTEMHQKNVKQMKVHDHLARMKQRTFMLRKCFRKWKEFVKIEQYSKQLLKEQDETKKKMQALLGAVANKARANELVLHSIEEDDDDQEAHVRVTDRTTQASKTKQSLVVFPKSNIRQTPPKRAWQVNRDDIKRLTPNQIENVAAERNFAKGDATRVKPMKQGQKTNLYNHRHEASKELITQQRQMISEQKQIIEEQKRLLDKKIATSSNNFQEEDETESVVSSAKSEKTSRVFEVPKKPKSLLAMEKRAEERQKRRMELEQKRREAERARIEQLRQEEEEKEKKEEEEKKRRAEELRKIKLLEAQKENERKEFIAKMKELGKMADMHYKNHLLRRYGLQPWKKLVKDQEKRMEIAKFHHEKTVYTTVMQAWHCTTIEMRNEHEQLSQGFNRKLLLRRYLGNWLKYGESMSILEKKAEIYNRQRMRANYWKQWERFVIYERLEYKENTERAAQHNKLRLKKRVFNIIRAHKLNIKRDARRNERLADMRRKVAQLLPDFKPDNSTDLS